MKTIAVIPTYNESENINELISKISSLDIDIDILFVDDNSPDGTADKIKEMMNKYSIFLIERKGKLGLSSAYIDGFKWALKKEYNTVIQMDADLSHNPSSIPNLLKEIGKYDLVIGSRYLTGINVVNWPLRRLILSYFANVYAKIITGVGVKDLTGGFKCFKSEVLESIDLDRISSEGYSFQIEMNCKAKYRGYSIKEVPIIFIDRTVGKSKMTKKIIFEAIWMVPYIRIKNFFGID